MFLILHCKYLYFVFIPLVDIFNFILYTYIYVCLFRVLFHIHVLFYALNVVTVVAYFINLFSDIFTTKKTTQNYCKLN